jgi:hypothetical protein
MTTRRQLVIARHRIARGETRDIEIPISETYVGQPVSMPLRVIRARKPGPTVFLTAAIHGDEINGTGIIRELLFGEPPQLTSGTLVCVPVVNVFGFETHQRYLPDGRDLNRSFPGSMSGSLAARVARVIMDEVVSQCDYGFDLHSAAATRTNYPNVRGDFRNPDVEKLAIATGCELLVNGSGPEGSFRRAACDAGCPTVILEAGEVGKIEPGVLEFGHRAVLNMLKHLGMLSGEIVRPAYQLRINRTQWIRAEIGGLLRFHVAPGDLVKRGAPIASNESVFGDRRSIIIAPANGVVLGMTTYPAVKPGEPVCHLALPGRKFSNIRRVLDRLSATSPESRLRDDMAAGIAVMPHLQAPL